MRLLPTKFGPQLNNVFPIKWKLHLLKITPHYKKFNTNTGYRLSVKINKWPNHSIYTTHDVEGGIKLAR